MSAPSILFFDVNGTLSDMGRLGATFDHLGLPEHLADVWFASLLRDGFALAATGVARPFSELAGARLAELADGLRLRTGTNEAVAEVVGAMSNLPLHPDVAPGVEALSDAGLRLATLSNGSPEVADQLLVRAGLRDRFEAVLSVEGETAWKPSPAAYDHACQRVGVAPPEAVLVACHPWDVHGAKVAGLRAAWVNRGGRSSYPGYFLFPDFEVAEIGELLQVIGAN